MAAKRLSMRKIREVLRLKYELGFTHRMIAKALRVAVGTVSEYLAKAKKGGLSWPLPEELSDGELEAGLFPPPGSSGARPGLDYAHIHEELRRHRELTLLQLWVEYAENKPGAYGYSRYCELYGQWKKKLNPTMRQRHRAGEKTFVDFSGKKPHIVDPKTGELVEMELFVGTLGASSYTYVEATLNQSLESWAKAHKGIVGLLRWQYGDLGSGQLEERRGFGGPLRARDQPDVRRAGDALRCGCGPGSGVQAERQSEGGVGSAGGAALDPGGASSSHVLQPGGTERSHLGEVRGPECASDAEARCESAGVVRKARPARTETATAGELRVIDVEAVQSEHRLPRGGGEQLVQRSLSAHSRESRGTGDGLGGGGPVQGKARRVASPQERKGALLHEPGAYATFASGAPGVDAVAAAPLGGAVRSRHGKAGCGDSRESASPGAGISLLPGSHATRQPLGQ